MVNQSIEYFSKSLERINNIELKILDAGENLFNSQVSTKTVEQFKNRRAILEKCAENVSKNLNILQGGHNKIFIIESYKSILDVVPRNNNNLVELLELLNSGIQHLFEKEQKNPKKIG